MGQVRQSGVVIESYGMEHALKMSQLVSDLYAAVFSLPPYNFGPEAMAHQRAHFTKVAARPGFRLVLARTTHPREEGEHGDYVAFGYGYLLPADTTWWRDIVEPLEADFRAETGSRTFAFYDFGVLPAFRGKGIGRLVHDELLGASGAERATLVARPQATETQALYRRWGWQQVGHEVMAPPARGPKLYVLVLDRLPERPTR